VDDEAICDKSKDCLIHRARNNSQNKFRVQTYVPALVIFRKYYRGVQLNAPIHLNSIL